MRIILCAVVGLASVAASAAGFDFEGIVKLPMCSASVIAFDTSKDSDPALVLTNGHCTGQVPPGTFVSHKLLQPRPMSLEFLNSSGGTAGYAISNELVYATMTSTDLALYLADMTYAQILSSFGVRPLVLSRAHAQVGDPIDILSGYFSSGYSCAIETFVPTLREDQWTDHDSIRYSRPGCDVIPGTSGSPVLAAGTRTVVGINNTANEDGQQCTWDNPCEVGADGSIVAVKGYAYAQEVFMIYSCLNSLNNFDLSVPGCLLNH